MYGLFSTASSPIFRFVYFRTDSARVSVFIKLITQSRYDLGIHGLERLIASLERSFTMDDIRRQRSFHHAM